MNTGHTDQVAEWVITETFPPLLMTITERKIKRRSHVCVTLS